MIKVITDITKNTRDEIMVALQSKGILIGEKVQKNVLAIYHLGASLRPMN